MKLGVILLAGGRSSRMQGPTPKTFLSLLGKPAILYSYEVLAPFGEVVLVAPKEYQNFIPGIRYALPGERRQDSVQNGLNMLLCDYVLVHDGARPLLKRADVERLVSEGIHHPAAALASPLRNTLKRLDQEKKVSETPSREDVWEVYTPQMVRYDLLKEGLKKADFTATDDLSIVESLGYKPKLVPSSFPNIKLTYPEDLLHVEALLKV